MMFEIFQTLTLKDMPFKGWDGINVPRSLELIEGLVPLVILDSDNLI